MRCADKAFGAPRTLDVKKTCTLWRDSQTLQLFRNIAAQGGEEAAEKHTATLLEIGMHAVQKLTLFQREAYAKLSSR